MMNHQNNSVLSGQLAAGSQIGPTSMLSFEKCERGFLFRESTQYTSGKNYAFDTVADAAAWLVERFAESSPCTRKTTTKRSS